MSVSVDESTSPESVDFTVGKMTTQYHVCTFLWHSCSLDRPWRYDEHLNDLYEKVVTLVMTPVKRSTSLGEDIEVINTG